MHLGEMACSGAGLFILEATAVVPEGRITPGDLGLWSDTQAAALAERLKALRSYSTTPLGIQLAHAGRKASCDLPWRGGTQLSLAQGGWETVSSSALPFSDTDRAPHALDSKGMQALREAFVAAALRAQTIGLDLIELHSAHGYLLHQFLSPRSNHRTDAYGGSLENRLRFPLEIFEALRAALPPGKPLGVRISACDWLDDGWDLAQSLVYAKALETRGCDFLHVSSGGLDPRQQLKPEPGYQLPFAAALKAALRMPVIAVGLITSPVQAEKVLAEDQADLVAIGRQMLFNPHWPYQAAVELGATLQVPLPYQRCLPSRHLAQS